MRRVPLSCLPFLTIACSAQPGGPAVVFDACQVTVVAGVGASDAERAGLAAGVAQWNQRGVTRFTLEDVPGAPRIEVTFEDAAAAFHGFYDPSTGDVFVNHALDDDHERAVTIAHELGHALGLPHVEDRPSVMRRANLDVEPNAADADAVRELWGDCAP